MKQLYFSLFIMILAAVTPAQNVQYRLLDQFYCKEKVLGSQIPNTLKMYDVTIDQRRGLAYVAGIVTRTTSIINLQNRTEIGAVNSNRSAGQLIGLTVIPGSGYLLQIFPELRPVVLDLLNPANSSIAGSYTFQSATAAIAGYTVDPLTDRVFIGDSVLVRILDGSNLTQLSAINCGITVGDAQIDTSSRKLYVSARNSAGGTVTIKIFSADAPYTLQKTLTVVSNTPLGRMFFNVQHNQIVCASATQVRVINADNGTIILSKSVYSAMNDVEYIPALQTVFGVVPDAYTEQGLHGSWCKFYRINTASGTIDSMMMGDKSSKLEYYAPTNTLVFPEMHSGYVSLYNPSTAERDSVDIGESVDYFSFSPDRSVLYLIKRLGGSRLLQYHTTAKTITESKTGAWPSTCETDSSLQKLFVINHFESSVSVLHCATGGLLTTIQLPLNEARTDAIVSSYLDQRLHKLFICIPELRKICIVDCLTYAVQVTTVPGYEYQSSDKGIGILQAVSDPRSNKVFCLNTRSKKVMVYNLNTSSWSDSILLGGLWNTALTAMQANCLTLDTVLNKLFVGNIVVNVSTSRPVQTISGPGAILGLNKQHTVLFGIGSHNDTVSVYELHPETFALQQTIPLFKASDFYTVVYKYDEVNNDLYIAEFNTAQVRRFRLEKTTGIDTRTPQTTASGYSLEQNYPNPFNPSTTISFRIPESGLLKLTVFDILGNEITTLVNANLEAGNHEVYFNGGTLSSGMYFYQMQSHGIQYTRKMLLVK